MSSPPAPTQDVASAVAQAIGAILRAMLDALFGDISGLAPRHPIRRAHVRMLRHIERYVAELADALAAPGEAPCDEMPLPPVPGPGSLVLRAVPQPRSASATFAGGHPRVGARLKASRARGAPRAPPEHPLLSALAVARPFYYDNIIL